MPSGPRKLARAKSQDDMSCKDHLKPAEVWEQGTGSTICLIQDPLLSYGQRSYKSTEAAALFVSGRWPLALHLTFWAYNNVSVN